MTTTLDEAMDGRALHVLVPDPTHSHLVPNEDVFSTLQKLGDDPVVVVSIVGAQRGGKSTLLNLLHSRRLTDGFVTGH